LQAQQIWFKTDTLTSRDFERGVKMTIRGAAASTHPQYLKMHLNNDTDEDLVVYDRTNSKVTTFLAGAGSG
jgi:hypothetical protein